MRSNEPLKQSSTKRSGSRARIDLTVEQAGIVPLRALHPATYLSKGKVEEIAGLVKSFEAGIVVMDCALTRCSSAISKRSGMRKFSTAPVSFWRFSAGAHARAKARCRSSTRT